MLCTNVDLLVANERAIYVSSYWGRKIFLFYLFIYTLSSKAMCGTKDLMRKKRTRKENKKGGFILLQKLAISKTEKRPLLHGSNIKMVL
jgi:hypothetical protein